MNFIAKNYKTLLQGLLTMVGLFFILEQIGFIQINPSSWLENVAIFTFWWLFFSFLIYKLPYFKQNLVVVYKMLGLLVILLLAIIADSTWGIRDNPITFPLLIFFWLGVAYLVLPSFFKKYKVAILSVYGAILSYFLFFRMSGDYFDYHKENIINFLIVPIPVLIGLWFYEQWRWMRTLQAEKGKAELALLKSQINPHFFFNTLNNLYGLVVEKSEKAPAVVLKLSDMMRYTIYEGREEFVSLKDEIDYLENYIELHKIRYQKKVNIVFNYEVAKEVQVAPLLFIILLENAFKHGVERLTENAYIHLNLQTFDEELLFSIENNFDIIPANPHKGIGLENLKKRLEHTYPNQHELLIESMPPIYKASLKLALI